MTDTEYCVICLGDVVARPGRTALRRWVRRLKEDYQAEFVVANCENASGGLGLDPKSAEELHSFGVDVITLGDHVWQKRELAGYSDRNQDNCIRPANYHEGAPGRGWTLLEKNGLKIGVMNLIGRAFMNLSLDCPFRKADEILEGPLKDAQIIVVDMHAEATSEKIAMGRYLDGRVSGVFGTHSHVQTADEQILPGGSAFLTDLGMCGCYDGVIGMDSDTALFRLLSGMPRSYKVAKGRVMVNGVALRFSRDESGNVKVSSVERILERLPD